MAGGIRATAPRVGMGFLSEEAEAWRGYSRRSHAARSRQATYRNLVSSASVTACDKFMTRPSFTMGRVLMASVLIVGSAV